MAKDKTKATLWQLTDEFEALDDLLMQDGGEITEEFEQLQEMLTHLMNEKVDGCAGYIAMLESDIENSTKRIKELKEFSEKKQKAVDRFKSHLIACIDKSEKDEFSGDFYTMKKRKPRQVFRIFTEENIPEFFYQEETIKTRILDKKQLEQWLKEGNEVNGVGYIDGKVSLNIAIKKGRDL